MLVRMKSAPFEFAVEDMPLGPLTMYDVGGPARLSLWPRTIEEACAAYAWMIGQSAPWVILGGGSNVLISDQGFSGIVLITTKLIGIEVLGGGRFLIEAGMPLQQVVRDIIVSNNYEGTGALAGIPGSVGGALYMNAGTVNGSICQLAESVEIVGPGGRRTVAMEAGLYGYRSQQFCASGELILRGTFRFTPAQEDAAGVYAHYLRRRREKQPQGHCCGSVFKNPPGDHAGRLIEACGLKGVRRGGAVISPVHANFIMNEGGAAFDDILWLIRLCKQRVQEQFGINLVEEVQIISPLT